MENKSILFLLALTVSLALVLSSTEAASAPSATETASFTRSRFMLNKPECNRKRIREADVNFQKLMAVGRGGRKLPETTAELKPFCVETNRLIGEIDKFITGCYQTEIQNIAKIMVFSVKRMMKTICSKKKTKKLQKFLEMTPCLNTIVDKIPCVEETSNKTRDLIPYRIENEKITYTCCAAVDGLQCADAEFDKLPCMTESKRELANDLVRSAINDLVNFACGDFNESTNKCDSIKWPPPSDKLDPKIKVDKNLKSFMMAGIGLLESIEKFDQPIN